MRQSLSVISSSFFWDQCRSSQRCLASFFRSFRSRALGGREGMEERERDVESRMEKRGMREKGMEESGMGKTE